MWGWALQTFDSLPDSLGTGSPGILYEIPEYSLKMGTPRFVRGAGFSEDSLKDYWDEQYRGTSARRIFATGLGLGMPSGEATQAGDRGREAC